MDFEFSEGKKKILVERETARTAKDWKKSDETRTLLAEEGIDVEDRPEGPFAKPKI